MLTTFILVIVTFIKGFKVDENPFFILVESLLNIVIIGDFLCRVRIVGMHRFFGRRSNNSNHELNRRIWNWLDAAVVFGSLILFLVIIFT